MTGYSALTGDLPQGALQLEIKSVNSRFLDIQFRIGEELRSLEPALRELIAAGKAPGLTKQTDLFTDPIGHGKEPILALTTYCNFACIYKISPVGLKDTNANLDKLSHELKPLLQQIAWDTVSNYPLSGVKFVKPSTK